MTRRLMLLVVFMCIMSSLLAFDGNRKGFLLGFGAGLAQTSFSQEMEFNDINAKTETMDEIGLATEFKIGYGLTNRFEVYYSNQVAWFSMENSLNEDITIADGISVIGGSYFLSSKLNDNTWHPSPFISAGIGLSSWDAPLEDEDEAWEGKGFFIGLGYEPAKHFRLSLNYFRNNPSFSDGGVTFTTWSNALLFTLSGMYF